MQPQPVGIREPGEDAKQRTQRVVGAQFVVTVSEYEGDREFLQAAHHEAEYVESRLIRPVHVLHDQDGGATVGELTEQGIAHLAAVARGERRG